MSRRKFVVAGLGVLGLLVPVTSTADPIKDALQRATEYLAKNQNPDGGYGPYGQGRIKNASDVGITGLVVYALAKHPAHYQAVDGPFVSEAVKYLLAKQQPDGGFYDPRDPVLLNYRTSVTLMALSALDRVQYSEAIDKARRFIVAQQLDEKRRYRRNEHLAWGGVGYGGSSIRPDLSNTSFAAEALKESGTSASDPLWKKLVVFTSRCQNSREIDPLLEKAGVGTSGDGGFRYAPNDTRGPVETIDGKRVFSSYGSMTYQGLKSLLYAGVGRDDPRVVQAFRWISRNFTVRENPGMASRHNPEAGKQGLFYYFHTMAKCLQAWGEPVIVDARGVKHVWARELSEHLLSLQREDGSWVNTSDRWWENIPALDTAFAMVALTICREELGREATAAAEKAAEEAAEEAAEGAKTPAEPEGK